jgi:hypothetical protein
MTTYSEILNHLDNRRKELEIVLEKLNEKYPGCPDEEQTRGKIAAFNEILPYLRMFSFGE